MTQGIIEKIEQHMVFIEGGTFERGGNRHKVEHDFYMSRYLLTQDIWQEVMGDNPAYFKGANRPTESVSWNDCQEFLQKLNQLSEHTYRLPTGAEWEYAARGGRYHSLNQGKINNLTYAGSNHLEEVAWLERNSHDETQSVGCKRPNSLGLFDMSGNVVERCQDGPDSRLVVRGGSWLNLYVINFRVSPRLDFNPTSDYNYLGFRLLRH